MDYLIISSSLNLKSRSSILAKEAYKKLKDKRVQVQLLDLRRLPLPFCDGDTCYDHKNTKKLIRKLKKAKCVIIAMPTYNFNSSSSVKNMIELGGSSWTEKVVGFLSVAGGVKAYMSVMSPANSLMLDYRCFIIPRFLYVTRDSFSEDGKIKDQSISERLDNFVKDAIKFTKALK